MLVRDNVTEAELETQLGKHGLVLSELEPEKPWEHPKLQEFQNALRADKTLERMIGPPHVWMRDGIMGSFCGRSWAPGVSKADAFDARGDAWDGYVLNYISKCLKNHGLGIVKKLQMPEPAALPGLFRTFAEKTGRNNCFMINTRSPQFLHVMEEWHNRTCFRSARCAKVLQVMNFGIQ